MRVAYGVSMRSHDSGEVGKLATLVYEKVSLPASLQHMLCCETTRAAWSNEPSTLAPILR